MSLQEITAYVLEVAKGYGVSSETPDAHVAPSG